MEATAVFPLYFYSIQLREESRLYMSKGLDMRSVSGGRGWEGAFRACHP